MSRNRKGPASPWAVTASQLLADNFLTDAILNDLQLWALNPHRRAPDRRSDRDNVVHHASDGCPRSAIHPKGTRLTPQDFLGSGPVLKREMEAPLGIV